MTLKIGAVLFISLFLGACVPAWKTNYIPLDGSANIKIVDKRPNMERVTNNLNAFGKEYPAILYGESGFNPGGFDVLKSEIQRRFGDRFAGKPVVVTSFRIIYFLPPQTNLDYLIHENIKRGFYGINDYSGNWFIGEMEVEVAGASAHAIYAQKTKECLGCDSHGEITQVMLTTIGLLLDDLERKLRQSNMM